MDDPSTTVAPEPSLGDLLDQIEARANAATEGPWEFGIAPSEGSTETKAEYMARALTDAGPLYALFVPATVGHPDGYLVPAVTGDGPNARSNAEFVAHARQDVPALISVVRAALEMAEKWRYKGEFGWGPWQAGEGPDQEGYVLDQASADLRAVITAALSAVTR